MLLSPVPGAAEVETVAGEDHGYTDIAALVARVPCAAEVESLAGAGEDHGYT